MATFFAELLATLGAGFLMFFGVCVVLFVVFYTGDSREDARKRAPELVKGITPITYSDILIFGSQAPRRMALHVEDKAAYPSGIYVFFCSLVGAYGPTWCVPVTQAAHNNIEIGAIIVVPESSCAM